MATIVTRAGKGSPLTHNEVDANFVNLNNDKAETASPALTGTVSLNGTAITSTAAELNKLAGTPAGLTATELGYVDGVTSAIQTQLDAKAPVTSPTLSGANLSGTTTITGGTADWTIVASGTNLTFAYNGVNKMRLDDSGNITVTGNVTAYGSVP